MNPLITIWYKTAETFDYLISTKKYSSKYGIIFYLVALTIMLQSKYLNIFYELGLPIYINIVIFCASVFISGLIFQLFWVFIFLMFGKLLQGKADNEEIRIVLAYSLFPILIELIIILLKLIINFGTQVQYFELSAIDYLTNTIISVLVLRLFVIGLSKVQKFSYGYALINILLPIGILGFISFFLRH
jgi:hypothetical protein